MGPYVYREKRGEGRGGEFISRWRLWQGRLMEIAGCGDIQITHAPPV